MKNDRAENDPGSPRRVDPLGRRVGYEYPEADIERAINAIHDGASYKAAARIVRNRRGDRSITLAQLKKRIDEHERRKAT